MREKFRIVRVRACRLAKPWSWSCWSTSSKHAWSSLTCLPATSQSHPLPTQCYEMWYWIAYCMLFSVTTSSSLSVYGRLCTVSHAFCSTSTLNDACPADDVGPRGNHSITNQRKPLAQGVPGGIEPNLADLCTDTYLSDLSLSLQETLEQQTGVQGRTARSRCQPT